MKNKILILLKIIFIISVIVWILLKFDLKDAEKILQSTKPQLILFAILLFFLVNLFASLRWKSIIKGYCGSNKNISLYNLYHYNLLAIFYVLFVPTTIAGEALRVIKLSPNIERDYIKTTYIVTLDRIIGMFTWLIIFLLIPSPLGIKKWFILLIIIPLLFLYYIRKRIYLFGQQISNLLKVDLVMLLSSVFFSFIAQIVSIIAAHIIFISLNIDINIISTAGIVTLATITGIIPISWLGLSLREGTYLGLLPVLGATHTQATLAMTIFIIMNYILGLVGGLVELAKTGWHISNLYINPQELTRSEK